MSETAQWCANAGLQMREYLNRERQLPGRRCLISALLEDLRKIYSTQDARTATCNYVSLG